MGGPGSGRRRFNGTRIQWCARCGRPYEAAKPRYCSRLCAVLRCCEDRGTIMVTREFVHPVVRVAGSAYRPGEVPAAAMAPRLEGPWELQCLGQKHRITRVRDTRVTDIDRLAYEGTDYAQAAAIRERLNMIEHLWAQAEPA